MVKSLIFYFETNLTLSYSGGHTSAWLALVVMHYCHHGGEYNIGVTYMHAKLLLWHKNILRGES